MSKIRTLREQFGLTQNELAEKLNVKRSTLSMWELEKSTPSVKTLFKIAKVFGCTINDLVDY